MEQKVLIASEKYEELDAYFDENNIRSVLLVCGKSIQFLEIGNYFDRLKQRKGIEVVRYDHFQPNPLYESVVDGVRLFVEACCDSIVAVGGGSAIDVAKCIKLYADRDYDDKKVYFPDRDIIPNKIKILGIPTTAGSGSEATRFAVIYYKGEKQSITHESCIPDTILMDAGTLTTLPLYQRKSTMLDAMCHSIESFWSINSTPQSREFSRTALKMILNHMDGYLSNDREANAKMLEAAHIAGKAINITQTTAGHAMCYKLTSMYGIAHGHAAALCVKEIWAWMLCNMDKCIDLRGCAYLRETFHELSDPMGCACAEEAAEKFKDIIRKLEMAIPEATETEYEMLCSAVNLIRLRNNPIALDGDDINMLYHRILRKSNFPVS